MENLIFLFLKGVVKWNCQLKTVFSQTDRFFFDVQILDVTKLSSAEPGSLLFLLQVLWAYAPTLLKCFLIGIQSKTLAKLASCFGERKWNSRQTSENVSIASVRWEVNLMYGTALVFSIRASMSSLILSCKYVVCYHNRLKSSALIQFYWLYLKYGIKAVGKNFRTKSLEGTEK